MTGWSYQPGRYVAGATVHVVPSREEAWSQSAVTALALSVPVVATAVDGLPTTLAGGRGLLVEPDPGAIALGIQRVLDGAAAIDIPAGRRYAATFEPVAIAAHYLAVYQQLTESRTAAVDVRRQAHARVVI
jgi:glycosyltransferase involved in cell wall biosynthesis